ncbi:MAG: undecaprenyl-diphosphate phosphatase [Clostridia bacterium]|nr:undecaprenyl-diphosphate phosphatase [Clostridia bacterium]
MDIFWELLKTVVWGIVEGITEWLPVSSTGHMILADELVKLGQNDDFKEMFRVVIELGAILAVVVLYWQKLFPWHWEYGRVRLDWNSLSLWVKVIVAVLPAAIIGLPLDDWFDEHFYNYLTVAITLILYGVLFIILENYNKKRTFRVYDFSDLSYLTAFGIGCFQVLSLVPGTSRSGATILGAMLIGCSRGIAAEFSFFLAIPVMFGASALKVYKYIEQFGFNFDLLQWLILAVGTLVAFVVSILAIRFLVGYVKHKDFKIFGYYRIILGIIVIAYFLWSY